MKPNITNHTYFACNSQACSLVKCRFKVQKVICNENNCTSTKEENPRKIRSGLNFTSNISANKFLLIHEKVNYFLLYQKLKKLINCEHAIVQRLVLLFL